MTKSRFSWPPLSDRCEAQEWLSLHRSYLAADMIEVPRWRFPDGSILIEQRDSLAAVAGGEVADHIVRRRARRRACWRAWRVWWQRRPLWGDNGARAQVWAWRVIKRQREREELYRGCDGSEGF